MQDIFVFFLYSCLMYVYAKLYVRRFNINLIFRTLRDRRNDKISDSKYILFNTKHQPRHFHSNV